MTLGLHRTLDGLNTHSPYARVFANAAARTADATVYDLVQTQNSGRPIKVLQLDNASEWLLVSTDPNVWTQVNVGGGGGEANLAANVGGAAGVFRDKVGVTLNLRSMLAGASMSVTQQADTITVALAALTAALNANSQDINALKTATFGTEFDGGNSGAAATVNWNNKQKQRLTLNANTVLSFTAPPGTGHFTLRLIQAAPGNHTVVWPASVIWTGGTAPSVGTGTGTNHLVMFYYNGTSYRGASLPFPA